MAGPRPPGLSSRACIQCSREDRSVIVVKVGGNVGLDTGAVCADVAQIASDRGEFFPPIFTGWLDN